MANPATGQTTTSLASPQSIQVPSPQYSHAPLPPDPTAFRLLQLDTTSAGVSYDIVSSNLKNPPPYEAISYRWGSDKIFDTIRVGASYLGITKSVHAILKALAPEAGGSRYLWIDFVCINQKDAFEKDSQIPLMRDVYGKASQVIAFIDEAPQNDGELVAQILPVLSQHLQAIFAAHAGLGGPPENPLQAFPEAGKAFQTLMTNSYWTRVWIIQELVMANKLCIHYGGTVIDWQAFSSATWACRSLFDGVWAITFESSEPGQFARSARGSNLIGNILDLREMIHDDKKELPLADVVLLSSQSLATNPEDKVNALVGLSTSRDDANMKPDHLLSVSRVFARAIACGLADSKFFLLNIAGLWRKTSRPLPSWVPDLSLPSLLWPLDNPASQYCAGGSSEAPQFSLLNDSTTLRIQGVHIDRIRALSSRPLMGIDNYTIEKTDEMTQLEGQRHREFWVMAEDYVPEIYPNGQTRDEALWRTLVGDENFDGSVSGSDWHFPAQDHLGGDYAMFKFAVVASQLEPEQVTGLILLNGLASELHLMPQAIKRICSAMGKKAWARKFAVTDKGYMALVMHGAEVGDSICVLTGSKSAYVLRDGEGGKKKLVSEAYIHGFMSGEAMREPFERIWFTID